MPKHGVKGRKNLVDPEELFLRKTVAAPCKFPDLGDCWIWTGSTMAPRYEGDKLRPQLNPKTWKTKYAAQWSCHHWNGSPLPVEPNMCVTHHCDTPLCVNPEHLKYDTWEANFQEMYERNPTALGRIVPTDEQLALIRRLISEGAGTKKIAMETGRSRTWVDRIRRDYFPA